VENDLQNDAQYANEIDLKELFEILLTGIRKIIAITTIFAIVSVFYALSIPNQYTATVQLAPAQSSSSDLSGTLKQLGGLASLAGVNTGIGQSSEAKIAQEIMQSWSFIEGFISDNDIAVEVYAVQGWDNAANKPRYNEDIYNIENEQWLIENESGVKGPPSSWSLFQAFSGRLAVSEGIKSGLVSVSIEHYSPKIAKQWLDKYVFAINKHMQQRQMAKVSSNINYLQAQIEKTSITEMREVFYRITEEQMKNKMLAEASPEYVFVAVSPSMVPEIKSKPQRAIICILGTLLGGILSVLLVLVLHFYRKYY
jgi:uncharacterized protein involved in exopolysaccharide biosynthesis